MGERELSVRIVIPPGMKKSLIKERVQSGAWCSDYRVRGRIVVEKGQPSFAEIFVETASPLYDEEIVVQIQQMIWVKPKRKRRIYDA